MQKLLVVALGCILFTGVGCQNKDNDHMDHKDKHGSMSKKDDCTHCPGVQTAKADGTCAMCGGQGQRLIATLLLI